MSETWNHPQLGVFKLNAEQDCWLGTCRLPAFSVFTWEIKSASAPEEYALVFESRKGRAPSEGAIMLGLRVIADQGRLPLMVASTLWEEFNGRGPKSEMWWYGGMDRVAENFGFADRSTPTGPDDLLPVMRFSGAWIRESLYEYNKPIVELAFSASFEEEHGVGVLTDGSKILGTGYVCDVSPYELT